MTPWYRNLLVGLICIGMTTLTVACDAESNDSSAAPEPALAEEEGGGSVDVASASPTVDVPAAPAVDAGAGVADTVVIPEEEPGPAMADATEGEPRFGDEIIVGDGACTNEDDLEALNGFDPVDDFMAIGMSCIDPEAGPGGTGDAELQACLIAKLGSEHGFSEGCGSCVAAHVICAQSGCMNACMGFMMSGEISDECTACIAESDCKDDFTDCSGLNPDAMQP